MNSASPEDTSSAGRQHRLRGEVRGRRGEAGKDPLSPYLVPEEFLEPSSGCVELADNDELALGAHAA
ncbi:hypothetical protein GCM10028793_11800 [Nocardiopsis oceani]